MDVVKQMRASHGDRDAALKTIVIVVRERLMDSVVFRTENGISELYRTLDNCTGLDSGMIPEDVGVYAMCSEISTAHRNYVIHSHTVHVSLSNMILKVGMMHTLQNWIGSLDDDILMLALRGTLENIMVPFCLFIHRNMCERYVAEIRGVLSNVIFPQQKNILDQWPDWNEDKKEETSETGKTCPITLDTIVDGVIASDGHLYERSAIMKHMIGKHNSPMTREFLDLEFVTW